MGKFTSKIESLAQYYKIRLAEDLSGDPKRAEYLALMMDLDSEDHYIDSEGFEVIEFFDGSRLRRKAVK